MHTPVIRTRIGPMHLLAEPLTRSAFRPFGDVLADPQDLRGAAGEHGAAHTINAGTATRYDDMLTTELLTDSGEPCLALFRTEGEAHRAPFSLREFERHLHGSQTFVPLRASRCMAIVTLGDRAPDLTAVRAFVVEPGQAITIRKGVWHHPLLTVGPADVLVLERRGKVSDCEICRLERRFIVTLPGA